MSLPNDGMETFYNPDAVIDTISTLSDTGQLQEAWNLIEVVQNRFLSKEQKTHNDSLAYLMSVEHQINILVKSDQFEKALEYADRCKKLIDDWQITNNVIIAIYYVRLAHLYNSLDLETQDKAIEAASAAMKAYKKGPYQSIMLFSSIVLQNHMTYSFSSVTGSTDSTLKYLDIQKTLYEDFEESIGLLGVEEDYLYLGYARLYSNSGDFSKAISYGLELQRKIEARKEQDFEDSGDYQENLFWLSVNYYYNKQYKESIYHNRKLIALNLKELSTNDYTMVQYYNLMGINNEGLNQLDSAMMWYKKCTDIMENEGIANNVYAAMLLNISSVKARIQDFESSEIYLMKALRLNKQIYGIRHATHSDFYRYYYDHYRLAGDQEKALYYIDSALWALEPTHNQGFISTPELKSNLVSFETLEILHLQMLQQLAVYLEKPEVRKEYLEAIVERAHAIQKILDDKRNSLNESESVLLHSEWFKSAYETVLEALNILYVESGDTKYLDQAMGYLTSGKSRSLVDEIGEFRLINSKNIPVALRKGFIEAKREVGRLNNELNRLVKKSIDSDSIRILNEEKFQWNNQFNEIRQTLINDYQQTDPLLSPLSDLDEIMEFYTLDQDNELILEYFMGENKITILALSKNQKHLFQVARDTTLDETLHDFLEQISSRSDITVTQLNQFQHRAHYLYQKLLSPVLERFGTDISKLTIIADDKLNLVPFELLVTKNEPALKSFKKFHFLIRDFAISYQLSASNIQTEPIKATGKGILGFGYKGEGISDERASLGGLPGSLEEVKYLNGNFKGTYYTGSSGDKQRFLEKARDYDVLHLALHGKADLNNRFNSVLIFNGESDYKLNAYDLYGIRLNPSMVVLSACESGIGKLSTAEGSFSVARGFASVGVPSIVTTLWKVNDQIGAQIVKEFYENLKQGLDKDLALQKAKLNFLESSDNNTSNPYFWGSFIVVGDTSPIELDEKNNSTLYLFLLSFIALIVVFVLRKRKKLTGTS